MAPTIGEVSTTTDTRLRRRPAAHRGAHRRASSTTGAACCPGSGPRSRAGSTVDEQLAALAAAVEALRTHATTPAELRDALALPFAEAREGAAEAVRLLRVLEARFARDTVNIGVSGQARVGKSTLLQSVSGSGRRPDPDRAGAAGHGRAQPDLPRARTCGARRCGCTRSTRSSPRSSRRTTRSWTSRGCRARRTSSGAGPTRSPTRSDRSGSRPTGPRPTRGGPAQLGHDAQPAARDAGVVPHVRARPHRRRARRPARGAAALGGVPDEHGGAASARSIGPARRRYLAVRDVRIDCPFPHAQVRHLGIVDLPGLGEFAARAEEHHVDGLQNEVDLVLMVKRPVEGMAYWGDARRARAGPGRLGSRLRGPARLRLPRAERGRHG